MKNHLFKTIKSFLLITLYFSLNTVFAQAPQKMSYQAVVRNAANTLIANTAVGVKISVLQTTATGTVVFSERHTPTTNANGLASFEIGDGTVLTGTFASINWANGPYFIKTETDPAGGTNYTIAGTSQLASVPYALFAANGGGTNSWTVSGTNISNNNTGNVGLGINNPSTKFHISGGIQTIQNDAANFTASAQHLILKPNTTAPSAQFPSVVFESSTGMSALLGRDDLATVVVYDATGLTYGELNAAAYNITSDARLKKEIHTISTEEYESYLEKFRNIQSATYLYNYETTDKSNASLRYRPNHHIGFLAQSLPKETVHEMKECKNPDMIGKLTVSLNEMTGLNTLGIKALDHKQLSVIQIVEKQQLQINQLIEKNNSLEARLKAIEKK